MSVRVGWAALVAVAVAVVAPTVAAGLTVEAGNLPLLFEFEVSPSKLPRSKPQPVRVLVSDKYETGDGVPALDELELELDRHLFLDVTDVPVCSGGTLNARGKVLEGCEDAIVGKGTIEAEVAYPESPIHTVSGDLTIYNRGRKPGGADLLGHAYFPAPINGAIVIPIKVRKHAGRYGWKARFEIPRIAGGAGSITSYSAHLGKRIFSATCDGRMVAHTISSFVDGSSRSGVALRTCTVAEADVRQ